MYVSIFKGQSSMPRFTTVKSCIENNNIWTFYSQTHVIRIFSMLIGYLSVQMSYRLHCDPLCSTLFPFKVHINALKALLYVTGIRSTNRTFIQVWMPNEIELDDICKLKQERGRIAGPFWIVHKIKARAHWFQQIWRHTK